MFDSHPELIDVIDESFFWEHVYNHQIRGLENLFIDTFRNSNPTDLVKGMISRELFACLDGIYSQVSNPPFSMDIKLFRPNGFLSLSIYNAGAAFYNVGA